MRRSSIALACATGLIVAGCGDSDPEVVLGPRHNIVLISIDTMRPDYLGCYGYERNVSPAIDAFAKQGVVFDDVTSASPWTLPSHATMLTGMYPSTHGVRNHEFSLTEESMATWLKKAEYQTFAVVNSHNIGFERYGLMRGFDRAQWVHEMDDDVNGVMQAGEIRNRAIKVARKASRMLEDRDPEKPFFLFLHFYDVHTDFTPLPNYEAEFVEPYDGSMSTVTVDLAHARNAMQDGSLELEQKDLDYLTQMYDAEIRTFDERLGQFLAYLDELGLRDNTLIAITSDHGEEYAEHGGLLHGRTHYQELVRIPLIVRGPGVPSGTRISDMAHLIDVAPMLYSLAGVPAPPGVDGLDASLSWNSSGEFPAHRFLFSEADHNNFLDGEDVHDIRRMVRYENTVLHFDLRNGNKELYDIEADPWEQNNLIESEPEKADMLFAKLEEFMSREGSAKNIGAVSEENQKLLNQLGYGGGND